jgi:hypothetical protein
VADSPPSTNHGQKGGIYHEQTEPSTDPRSPQAAGVLGCAFSAEILYFERFDTNRDGTLDLNEWEAACLEARREVEKTHAELRMSDGVNILCKPSDGRVFLLTAEVLAKIERHFAFWSWIHLIFFRRRARLHIYFLSEHASA